jgi:hypothetical protein
VNTSTAVRRGLLAAAAALACLAFVPKAHASLLVADADGVDCGSPQLSQPFLPWLDPGHYFSIGTFENGAAGWTLSGGASVTSGNEPWQVSGSGDSNSLSLPSGATAVSPVSCVGIDSPSLRFFARRSTRGLLGNLASLEVDALVQDNLGHTLTVPVLVTGASSSWTPTVTMPVVADLLPLLPGNQTPVAFKFTALGSADWQIDDTYVDPMHCC